jgi:hypothetical protein
MIGQFYYIGCQRLPTIPAIGCVVLTSKKSVSALLLLLLIFRLLTARASGRHDSPHESGGRCGRALMVSMRSLIEVEARERLAGSYQGFSPSGYGLSLLIRSAILKSQSLGGNEATQTHSELAPVVVRSQSGRRRLELSGPHIGI